MRTPIATLLSAAFACGVVVATVAQQPVAPAPLTVSEVRQLIANAQPADHARLRSHFEALAARYEADAARHASIARTAGGDPNRRAGSDPGAHHMRLAALARESAGITRELATHHATLAKGIASTAPRDSERFEKGEGAATMPSERQLMLLAARAATPSEHGELAEYYLQLAAQYSATAAEHSAMAAAYRGTKSGGSMTTHFERLAQIARDESKEATALASDHQQMARVVSKADR